MRVRCNGDDRILDSKSDADSIFAGSGADKVWADAGDDHVFGDNAQDMLYGESGNDIIQGDSETDILVGDTGDDYPFAQLAHISAINPIFDMRFNSKLIFSSRTRSH